MDKMLSSSELVCNYNLFGDWCWRQQSYFMEPIEFTSEKDSIDRAAEFAHNIGMRVGEMAQQKSRRPRYWVEEAGEVSTKHGPAIFVLIGTQIPGDFDFPGSWISYFYNGSDNQLYAAKAACHKLCSPRTVSQAWIASEETSDAVWYGFEFDEIVRDGEKFSRWDQIKTLMVSLLGEPGEVVRTMF